MGRKKKAVGTTPQTKLNKIKQIDYKQERVRV